MKPTSFRTFVHRAIATGMALLLVSPGCTVDRQRATGAEDFNATTTMAKGPIHVVLRDALFFTTSPMQGRPPDGTVRAGTRVQPTGEKIGGYSGAMFPDGRFVYIEVQALQRAK